MKKKLNILMLAYVFPPDAGSGTFRSLSFSYHLQKKGANVTVLTANEKDYSHTQLYDPTLMSQIHPEVNVVRARVLRPLEVLINLKKKISKRKTFQQNKNLQDFDCMFHCNENTSKEQSVFFQGIKNTITDLLACPDEHIGWLPDAIRKGRELVKSKGINVIYASGGPWSCLLVGSLLRKKTGIPLVLDFRDPWVANPNFKCRGKVSRLIQRHIEKKILMGCEAVVANTDELRQDFLKRYSFLGDNKVHTITNGFEDFIDSKSRVNRHFNITHAGMLYLSRDPKPLLKALYEIIYEGLLPIDKIRLNLVGGISINDIDLRILLEKPLLKNVVRIISRVSHEKALDYQIKADLLLVIQSGFPLQIPRKLYEYISVQRPILAITAEDEATGKLMKKYDLGMVVKNEVEAIKAALLETYEAWQKGTLKPPPKDKVKCFQNQELANHLYEVLETASGMKKL